MEEQGAYAPRSPQEGQTMSRCWLVLLAAAGSLLPLVSVEPQLRGESPARQKSKQPQRTTSVTIQGEMFHINGQPTYKGRTFNGKKIEGLLLNSRMVQAIFDDLNPETVHLWAYPDTKKWDPERN